MSTRVEIEGLLRLISDAALSALAEYEKYGVAAPHLQSTDTHPLDFSTTKTDFMKAIATLEGACEQICTTLATPTHTIMSRVQDYQWIALRTAVKHTIADHLATHPEGLPLGELAASARLHPSKLGAILRVLATKHCFQEVSPGVFANNRLSTILSTSHPMSSAVIHSTDRHEYIHCFPEYLSDPDMGHSLKTNEALFQYFVNNRYPDLKGITYYGWMELPINDQRRIAHDRAMICVNESMGNLSAIHAYDWTKVANVCDVGAGIGHFSKALLEVKPHLHATIFDLPKALENTKSQWGDIHTDRVCFLAGDFLQKMPAKSCDVYYLRNILHNWTDEQAAIILRNIRNAMTAGSRLLIHDPILRPLHRSQSSADLAAAPEPLLPNYGAGYVQVHNLNVTMMSMFNAIGRYPPEVAALAEAAGLSLVQIYDLSTTCMLEFSLRN